MPASAASVAIRWNHRRLIIALCVLAGCAQRSTMSAPGASSIASATPPPTVATGSGGLALPTTRAERTKYREPSTYADVMRFIDSLVTMKAPIAVQELAKSANGRSIPLIIAARPRVSSAIEARRTGRPIVYVQANIHAGDDAGKESVLALLREWSFGRAPNILDSLVLIVVPMYNADNATGLNRIAVDLNRDFIKAEAPETRGALAMLNVWEPDVFIDLQTATGRVRGYTLTSAPAMHPATPLARLTADTLLPEIQRRLRARHKLHIATQGADAAGNLQANAPAPGRTSTYPIANHQPRAGTSYYGLRGRIGILGESFADDPLAKRVTSTRHFVQETLSLLAERRTALRSSIGAGIARSTFLAADSTPVALRAAITRVPSPHGYALDDSWTGATRVLRMHGVTVIPLARAMTASLQVFDVDSVVSASQSIQGHYQTTVVGRWRDTTRVLPVGTLVVAASTPRDLLAMILIDPESDDGLFTWNLFDGALVRGKEAPVVRLMAPLRLYSPRRSGDDLSPR